MNRTRRNQLSELGEQIEEIRSALEELKEEEEAYKVLNDMRPQARQSVIWSPRWTPWRKRHLASKAHRNKDHAAMQRT